MNEVDLTRYLTPVCGLAERIRGDFRGTGRLSGESARVAISASVRSAQSAGDSSGWFNPEFRNRRAPFCSNPLDRSWLDKICGGIEACDEKSARFGERRKWNSI